VDEECFNDLKEMTLEFRRQVQKRVEEVQKPTKVMQFLFSLFPVADTARIEKKTAGKANLEVGKVTGKAVAEGGKKK